MQVVVLANLFIKLFSVYVIKEEEVVNKKQNQVSNCQKTSKRSARKILISRLVSPSPSSSSSS